MSRAGYMSLTTTKDVLQCPPGECHYWGQSLVGHEVNIEKEIGNIVT